MVTLAHSVCPHDCPSQCALSVTVEEGRVTAVAGDPTHPFTRGVVCGKVHDYAERLYAPTRVLTPLRRVGAKGEGRFERVSWDDAIEEIAHRWRRVIAQWGGEAILPFSYAGTLGLVQYWAGHPLFHALGASQLDRTICISTAYAGWMATVGTVAGNDAEQMVDSDLVVLWGINASYSHINLMSLVKKARQRGAFIVGIDPYRTPTAKLADLHLQPRPGTDGALALGMMHVLIGEGLIDDAYLQRATLGFGPRSRDHVRQYDPERVAAITGNPPGQHRVARAALRSEPGPLSSAWASGSRATTTAGAPAEPSRACPPSPAPMRIRRAAPCSRPPRSFGLDLRRARAARISCPPRRRGPST